MTRRARRFSSNPHGPRPGQFGRHKTRRVAARILLAVATAAVVTLVCGLLLGWRNPIFWLIEPGFVAFICLLDQRAYPILVRREHGATGEESVGG